jgi:SMI1-KNR4 cell-wall
LSLAMADTVNLDYDPDSFVGPFDLEEAREFEKWWLSHEYPFELDASYLEHLSRYHGGKPGNKCFRSQDGRERVLERFLNFVKDYKKGEWGNYHVEVMRCLVEDRLDENLLPFAVLFAGDLLCFDYSKGGRPAVVVWMHEESAAADTSITEPVAPDFDRFLRLLHPCETD